MKASRRFLSPGGARAGDSSEYDTAEETASVTSSHISEPDSIDEGRVWLWRFENKTINSVLIINVYGDFNIHDVFIHID